LHLNSKIFPINSDADAAGIPRNDSNANEAFARLLNSDSDYDSAKVRMHSITNADSNSDSPSLNVKYISWVSGFSPNFPFSDSQGISYSLKFVALNSLQAGSSLERKLQ